MKTKLSNTMMFVCTFFLSIAIGQSSADDSAIVKQPSAEAIESNPKIHVKMLRSDKLLAKLDGKAAKATILELTLDPLASSPPHRHPGSVSGYVVEGNLEFQIGDEPLRKFKAGDTFFEPRMILHRVTRNPDSRKSTRIVITMVHPADAKKLTIMEMKATVPK